MLKCDLASNLTVAAAKRGGLLLARLPKELLPPVLSVGRKSSRSPPSSFSFSSKRPWLMESSSSPSPPLSPSSVC